jgi:hypothetical protein
MDLQIYQGDDQTWPLTIRFVDRTDPLNPVYTPCDLTLYTLQAQIRSGYADDVAVVEATLSFETVDAAAGSAKMLLRSEDSAKLSGSYKWDLQLVRTADDYITTVLFGSAKTQREVTRP